MSKDIKLVFSCILDSYKEKKMILGLKANTTVFSLQTFSVKYPYEI